jgi:uncharacterized protein YcnI
MTITTSARRRILTGAAGATLLTAGLVLAAPLAASAHVTVTPDQSASAGGHGVLTFAFSHGCDGSPTNALTIDIPDGVASVSPTIEPGWSIAVDRDTDDGLVTSVTYTAQEPVESGLRAALALGVTYAEDAAGQTLAFPTVQTCEVGEVAWTDVAATGEDAESLESPAPTVVVGAASESAHGHGGTEGSDASDAAAETTAAEDAPASVAVWLGAGGLALGAAGLVTGIAAFRRARR